MSPAERVRVETELARTLNPDQLVLEGLEIYVRTRPPQKPVQSDYDNFIDNLHYGVVLD